MKIQLLNKGKQLLILAGCASFAVALLHIVIFIGGPEWFRFFGAGEQMATMAEQGSGIPAILTLGITGVFIIWGLYAFSGAGLIRRLPLLKLGLITISAIYFIRGLGLIPVLAITSQPVNALILWSSIVSTIIGMLYAIGTGQLGQYKVQK